MTMKPLKCLCIDDETHALDLLEMYIEKTPFLTLVKRTSDAWDGLNFAEEGKADLIFLDIQMDTISGIQFMEILKNNTPIILTTAYEQYALKSYEFEVVDYLLKPFSYNRFLKAVMKLKENNPKKNDIAPKEVDDFLLIKSDAKNKFYRIKKSDILYVESLRNYVQFYTSAQKVISLQTLSQTEENLGSPFIRIHKSFIINMDQIDLVDGNTVYIQKKVIPIGQSYRSDFFKILRGKSHSDRKD